MRICDQNQLKNKTFYQNPCIKTFIGKFNILEGGKAKQKKSVYVFVLKQVKRGFTNYQPKKLLKTTTCHEV